MATIISTPNLTISGATTADDWIVKVEYLVAYSAADIEFAQAYKVDVDLMGVDKNPEDGKDDKRGPTLDGGNISPDVAILPGGVPSPANFLASKVFTKKVKSAVLNEDNPREGGSNPDEIQAILTLTPIVKKSQAKSDVKTLSLN